jgi:hypothetical protein
MLILLVVLLIGYGVIAARIHHHAHHGGWTSFVLALGVLCVVGWKAARVAMNASRHTLLGEQDLRGPRKK